MPGDAFPSREDIEAIDALQMEHQRAPLPDGPLRDEMSAHADLENRFEELTRHVHRPTPPIGEQIKSILPLLNRSTPPLRLIHFIPRTEENDRCDICGWSDHFREDCPHKPGHQCWAFHNPGVWPWVARCVLDPVHTTTGLVWPHRDANGRTWVD